LKTKGSQTEEVAKAGNPIDPIQKDLKDRARALASNSEVFHSEAKTEVSNEQTLLS